MSQGGVEVERLVVAQSPQKLADEIADAHSRTSPAQLRQRLVSRLVTEAFAQTHTDHFARRVSQRQAFLSKYLWTHCSDESCGSESESGGEDQSAAAASTDADDAHILPNVAAAIEAFDAMLRIDARGDEGSPKHPGERRDSLQAWSLLSARLRWRLYAMLDASLGARFNALFVTDAQQAPPPGLGWGWDSSNCGANIAVTSEGAVITLGDRSGQTTEGARGTVGWSSGVHRWTVEWLNDVGTHSSVGVCTPDHAVYVESFDHAIGGDSLSWGWHSKGGNLLHAGGVIGTCDSWGEGDQIECLLDCDAGTLVLFKNGDRQSVEISGLQGLTLYPCLATPWFKGAMRLVATSDSGDVAASPAATSALRALVPTRQGGEAKSPLGSKPTVAALRQLLERLMLHINAVDSNSSSSSEFIDLEASDALGEAAATATAIMLALQRDLSVSAATPLSLFACDASGPIALETVLRVAAEANRFETASIERTRDAGALLMLNAIQATASADGEVSSLPPTPPDDDGAASSAPEIKTHTAEMRRVVGVDASDSASEVWHPRCVAVSSKHHCAAWGIDRGSALEALSTVVDAQVRGYSPRAMALLRHSAAHALTVATAIESLEGTALMKWTALEPAAVTFRFSSAEERDACMVDLDAARAADADAPLDTASTAATTPLQPGDRVRVREDVPSPAFGWGSVNHSSVGLIVSISGDRTIINFPSNTQWNGSLPEMERVPLDQGIAVGDVVRVSSTRHSPELDWARDLRGVVRSIRSGHAKVDFPRRSDTKVKLEELENANRAVDALDPSLTSTSIVAGSTRLSTEVVVRMCLESATLDLRSGSSDVSQFADFIGQFLYHVDISVLALLKAHAPACFALGCLDAILNTLLAVVCCRSSTLPVIQIAKGVKEPLLRVQRILRESGLTESSGTNARLARNASRLVSENLAAIGGRLAIATMPGSAEDQPSGELHSWLGSKLLAGGLRGDSASADAEAQSEMSFLLELTRSESSDVRTAFEAAMGPEKTLRKRMKKKAFRKEPRCEALYYAAQAALLYATGTSREALRLVEAHSDGGSLSLTSSPELSEAWLYSAAVLKRFERLSSTAKDSFFASAMKRARLVLDTVQTWGQIKPGLQRQMSAALRALEEERPQEIQLSDAGEEGGSKALAPSPLRVMLSDETTSVDAEHTRFYLSLWQQLGKNGDASKALGYRGAARSTIQGAVISFIFAESVNPDEVRTEMTRRTEVAETRASGMRLCTAALAELRLLGQPLATLDFARALNLLYYGAYSVKRGDVQLISHYTVGLKGTGAAVAESLRASFAAMAMQVAQHIESDVPWVEQAVEATPGSGGCESRESFLHAATNAKLQLLALCAMELYPQDQSLPVETTLLSALKKQSQQISAADERRRSVLQRHVLAEHDAAARAEVRGLDVLKWDRSLNTTSDVAYEAHGLLVAQSSLSEWCSIATSSFLKSRSITVIIESNTSDRLRIGLCDASLSLSGTDSIEGMPGYWLFDSKLETGQILLLNYDSDAATLSFAVDGGDTTTLSDVAREVRVVACMRDPKQMVRLIPAVSTEPASPPTATSLGAEPLARLSQLSKQLASLRRSVWNLQQILALMCLDMTAHAPRDDLIDTLMDAIAQPLDIAANTFAAEEGVRPQHRERVFARWKNGLDRSFPDWYGAAVIGVNDDGTFSLRYDDRCSDSCVPPRLIRSAQAFFPGHLEPTERIQLHIQAVQAFSVLTLLLKDGNRCVGLELQRQPWLDRLSKYIADEMKPTSNRQMALKLVELILTPMRSDAGSTATLKLVTSTLVDVAGAAYMVPRFVERACSDLQDDEEQKTAARPRSVAAPLTETVEGAPKAFKILSTLLSAATDEALIAANAARVLTALTSTSHWHWKNVTVRLCEVLRSFPALVERATLSGTFTSPELSASFAKALAAAAALSSASSVFSPDETAMLLRFAMCELEEIASGEEDAACSFNSSQLRVRSASSAESEAEDALRTCRVRLAASLLQVCAKQMEHNPDVAFEIALESDLLEKISAYALQTLPMLVTDSASANVFAARMRVRTAARKANIISIVADSVNTEVWGVASKESDSEGDTKMTSCVVEAGLPEEGSDAPRSSFPVASEVMKMCTFFDEHGSASAASSPLSCPRVSSSGLKTALGYCGYVSQHGDSDIITAARAGTLDRISVGALQFVDVAAGVDGIVHLFVLLRAAHELGCESFLNIVCATLLSLVARLTALEEVRSLFGLDDDAEERSPDESVAAVPEWLSSVEPSVERTALTMLFAVAAAQCSVNDELERVIQLEGGENLLQQAAVHATFLRFLPWGQGPWRYIDVSPRGVGVRESPDYPGVRVDPYEAVVGGAVLISERIEKMISKNAEGEPCAPHKVVFLKLEDGRGWVFDCLPADGTPLMQCDGAHQSDAAVLGPLPAASGGALETVDFRSLQLQRALHLLRFAPTLLPQRSVPFTDLAPDLADDTKLFSAASLARPTLELEEEFGSSLGERACETIAAVHNARDILMHALRCWSTPLPSAGLAFPPVLRDGVHIMQMVKLQPKSAFSVLPSILKTLTDVDVGNIVTCAVQELLGAAVETCQALNKTVSVIPGVALDISGAVLRSAKRKLHSALPVSLAFSFCHPSSRLPSEAGFIMDVGATFPTPLPSAFRSGSLQRGIRSAGSADRASAGRSPGSRGRVSSRRAEHELRRRSRVDQQREITFGWMPQQDHEQAYWARDRSVDDEEWGRVDGAKPDPELLTRHLTMSQLVGGPEGYENRSEWILSFPKGSPLARGRYRVCIECCDASFEHAASLRINGTRAGEKLGGGGMMPASHHEHAWFIVEITDGKLRIDSSQVPGADGAIDDAPACISSLYIEGPIPARPRPRNEVQFFKQPDATLALRLLEQLSASSHTVLDLLLAPSVLPMVTEFMRVSVGNDRLLPIRLVHSALIRQHKKHCDATGQLSDSAAAVYQRLTKRFDWLPAARMSAERSELRYVSAGAVFSQEVQRLIALEAAIERYAAPVWLAAASEKLIEEAAFEGGANESRESPFATASATEAATKESVDEAATKVTLVEESAAANELRLEGTSDDSAAGTATAEAAAAEGEVLTLAWEQRQVGCNIQLSGDPPLTVTSTSSSGHGTQASTSFACSAEVTLQIDANPSLSSAMCVGVMDANMPWDHSDFVVSKAGHWLYVSDGSMWNCASNADSGSAPLNEGSTITIKVNMLSATVHFFHNGTMVGNPDGLSMMGRLPEALRLIVCFGAEGQRVSITSYAFVEVGGVGDASALPDIELEGGVVGYRDSEDEIARVSPSFDPPPLTGQAKERMEQAEQVQMFTGHELELCLYAIKAGHDNWRGSHEERDAMGPVSVAADWIFQVSESHLERVRKQLAGHNVVWGVPTDGIINPGHPFTVRFALPADMDYTPGEWIGLYRIGESDECIRSERSDRCYAVTPEIRARGAFRWAGRRAPWESGDFELRYFSGPGFPRKIGSVPLRCEPAAVTSECLLRLERCLHSLRGADEFAILSAFGARLQTAANRQGVSPLQLPPDLFHDQSSQRIDVAVSFSLSTSPKDNAADWHRAQMLKLQRLNMLIVRAFPALQLGPSTQHPEGHLVALVLKCRPLIFEGVKLNLLRKAMDRTSSDKRPPTLLFNRIRARAAAAKTLSHDRDSSTTHHEASMFEQALRHLGTVSPAAFRRNEHAWEAKFEGEGGEGVGLYRICISQMCSELQSRGSGDNGTCLLPLLVPTDNHRLDTGLLRECWTLNPSASKTSHVTMLRFFGRLLGLAIRSKGYMPLALAPTFWRQLVHLPRGFADINEVDGTTAKVLDIIRGAPKVAAGDPLLFRSIVPGVLRFKVTLSDMSEVELIPGGRDVEVTLENCEEYCRLLVQARLDEANEQLACLRAGLAEVVPLPLLQLFTWQEAERLVCGSKLIDLDLLRSVTDYGSTESDSGDAVADVRRAHASCAPPPSC